MVPPVSFTPVQPVLNLPVWRGHFVRPVVVIPNPTLHFLRPLTTHPPGVKPIR